MWKRRNDDAKKALDRLNTMMLPTLGDPSKVYVAKLTEPEINAIYAAVSFVQTECATLVKLAGGETQSRFWNHYGPTLSALSYRLSTEFDD
jgi:hypothetical protein